MELFVGTSGYNYKEWKGPLYPERYADMEMLGWGYLGLRGRECTPAELSRWAQEVGEQAWERTFVFFEHETEGPGPKLANSFIEVTLDGGCDR